MIDHKQLLADSIRSASGVTAMHVGDFSEADMVVRPCDKSNHAAWHLGHMAVSTANLFNMVSPGCMPDPSSADKERYSGKGAHLNDGFPPKEQLLQRIAQANDAVVAFMQKLPDAQWSTPTPQPLQGFAKTVGHLIYVQVPHLNMHVGQLQVIRRTLGKPILF